MAHPVMAEKIRYYRDKAFTDRLLPRVTIPELHLSGAASGTTRGGRSPARPSGLDSTAGDLERSPSPGVEASHQEYTGLGGVEAEFGEALSALSR